MILVLMQYLGTLAALVLASEPEAVLHVIVKLRSGSRRRNQNGPSDSDKLALIKTLPQLCEALEVVQERRH